MVATPTVNAIQASASRHAELVRGINELDYAKPALAQCSAYLKDLQMQVKRSEADLKRLAKSTEKERAEHIELKKSLTRKWSSKLVGRGDKYEKKVTKEEKEYIEALEHEHEARGKHEKLLSDIDEAEKNTQTLQQACSQRDRLQAEIDALYERVFSGSTPDFPQEDEYEDRVSATEAANYQAQSDYTHESQTLAILNQAEGALLNCLNYMNRAKEWSTYDVWGGGFGADMAEGDMLMSAQTAASQFGSHMAQARRMNGAVRDVPVPQTPRQSAMDVYFDNIFSDLAMHDKIKAALLAVEKSRSTFNRVHEEARRRVDDAASQAAVTSSAAAQARHELHDLRAAMFASVLSGGGATSLPAPQEGGAPPPFSVMDRTPPPIFSPTPPPAFSTSQTAYAAPPGPPPGHAAPDPFRDGAQPTPMTGSAQRMPLAGPPPSFSSTSPGPGGSQYAPPSGLPPSFAGSPPAETLGHSSPNLSTYPSSSGPSPNFPVPSPASPPAPAPPQPTASRPLASNNPYAALLAAGRI